MTRFSRAASTTSVVADGRALISRIRSTASGVDAAAGSCRRKWPPVIRMIETANGAEALEVNPVGPHLARLGHWSWLPSARRVVPWFLHSSAVVAVQLA